MDWQGGTSCTSAKCPGGSNFRGDIIHCERDAWELHSISKHTVGMKEDTPQAVPMSAFSAESKQVNKEMHHNGIAGCSHL